MRMTRKRKRGKPSKKIRHKVELVTVVSPDMEGEPSLEVPDEVIRKLGWKEGQRVRWYIDKKRGEIVGVPVEDKWRSYIV